MLQAMSFANFYAPEHLIINVKDAEKWEGLVENAGIYFLHALMLRKNDRHVNYQRIIPVYIIVSAVSTMFS